MSKILTGTITYILLTLIIGFTWNFGLFKETYFSYASSVYREAPLMQFGLIAVIMEGVALSFIFSKFYKGDKGKLDYL